MHFVRWIGAGALLFLGVLLGLAFSGFEKRRLLQAEGFLSLLRYIRLQIDCFSLPLGKILATVEEKTLADCGAVGRPRDFEELLSGTSLYLSEEICRLLFELSARLGGSYREEQLRCCDYYIARLSPYCDSLRADLPRREKMALFLPPALAVAWILLLL